jgi:hypothetical protein
LHIFISKHPFFYQKPPFLYQKHPFSYQKRPFSYEKRVFWHLQGVAIIVLLPEIVFANPKSTIFTVKLLVTWKNKREFIWKMWGEMAGK